jgi:hypothetical protein
MKPMNNEFLLKLAQNERETPLVYPKYRTLDEVKERIKTHPKTIDGFSDVKPEATNWKFNREEANQHR